MKYTFFWTGEFSQWHPSEFEIQGVKYNCAEQYMMASKARLFGDDETLGKIMKANSPKTQKKLGRQVKGFKPDVWEKNCKKFVYDGNVAKFSQNEHLKDVLKGTIGTMMVEASPLDKVWGVGLAPDDPLVQNPSNWKGTNYLGQVLTAVRKNIFNHEDDAAFSGI